MPDYPQYSCHKVVRAFKLQSVTQVGDTDSYTVHPVNELFPSYQVTGAWMRDFNPNPGDYVVFYEDGYVSVSPPGPFESGYTLVPPR